MSVKASIDLSGTLGPINQQGNRPTCLAMALSDLNGHASVVFHALSAEYLYRAAANQMQDWKAGGGLDLVSALKAVSAPGQPSEDKCPYLPHEPMETPPVLSVHEPADMYASAVTAHDLKPHEVVEALQSGRPVGLVLKLTPTFYQPVAGRVDFSAQVLPGLRHAVIATGVGTHDATKEIHFLIRNSWGVGWGNNGSAWLPLAYVQSHAVKSFKV